MTYGLCGRKNVTGILEQAELYHIRVPACCLVEWHVIAFWKEYVFTSNLAILYILLM